MSVRDELKDPLGWVVAVTAGGVGVAVLASLGAVAILLGIGIAAIVMGTKVAIGARTSQSSKSLPPGADLPKPPRGSRQSELLRRAEVAFDRLNELSDRPGDQWLQSRVGLVDDQALEVMASMHELAGRATVLERSVAAANPVVLRQDAQRLTQQLSTTQDPELRAEREKTLAAIASQGESIKRLSSLNETLLSRMHSAAVGLEGLATRTGELVAMGPDTVNQERADQVLGELTSDLDTMRKGLKEAEIATRRLS